MSTQPRLRIGIIGAGNIGGTLTRRLREIQSEKLLVGAATPNGDQEKSEADVLNEWLDLSNREAELKRQIKETDAVLDAKAYAQYPKLTEAEIQTLVIDDKWVAGGPTRAAGRRCREGAAWRIGMRESGERAHLTP